MLELFAAFTSPTIQLGWSSSAGEPYDAKLINQIFAMPTGIGYGKVAFRYLSDDDSMIAVALYRNIEPDQYGRDGGFRVAGLKASRERGLSVSGAFELLLTSFVPTGIVFRASDLLGGVVEVNSTNELHRLVVQASGRLAAAKEATRPKFASSVNAQPSEAGQLVSGILSRTVGRSAGVRTSDVPAVLQMVEARFDIWELNLELDAAPPLGDGQPNPEFKVESLVVTILDVRRAPQRTVARDSENQEHDPTSPTRGRTARTLVLALSALLGVGLLAREFWPPGPKLETVGSSVPVDSTSGNTSPLTSPPGTTVPVVTTVISSTVTTSEVPTSTSAPDGSDQSVIALQVPEVGQTRSIVFDPSSEWVAAMGESGVAIASTTDGVKCVLRDRSGRVGRSVEFSPASGNLMVADADGRISLVSSRCEPVAAIETGALLVAAGFSKDGYVLVLSEAELAGASHGLPAPITGVRLSKWDSASGLKLAEFTLPWAPTTLVVGEQAVYAVSLSDGKILAIDATSMARSERQPSDFSDPLLAVSRCDQSDGTADLVGLSADGTAVLAVGQAPEQRFTTNLTTGSAGFTGFSCSNDATLIASDRNVLEIVPLLGDKPLASVDVPSVGSITSMAFNHGILAVSDDEDRLVIFGSPTFLQDHLP